VSAGAAGGKNKRRTVVSLLAVVVGMSCLAYASVPLYRIFCQVTGFAGTTQRVESAPGADAIGTRQITVRFDAGTASGMPWEFAADQVSVKVRVGEPTLISYHARNKTNKPITGQATFNVTPLKAGIYFDKIQCFCFNEQTLAAGERAEMPVQFYINPDIVKDHNLDDVDTITLSYTFFRARDGADKPAAAAERAAPPKS
jgi:cytochrome c oxidase assembly protein subunit 11